MTVHVNNITRCPDRADKPCVAESVGEQFLYVKQYLINTECWVDSISLVARRKRYRILRVTYHRDCAAKSESDKEGTLFRV
jgi:hypothetical protein